MIKPEISVIDGLNIAESVLGEGQPVLMLHGWGASLKLMLPLAQQLAAYKVYLLDMPGFGDSDPPPAAWGVADYTNFVLSYLDHHALDTVHLIGHSFGGRIGLVMGANHATRLNKMVLIDSAGVRTPSSRTNQLRLKSYRFALNTLGKIGLSTQADQLRAWYTGRYGSSDYKAATGVIRETFVKVVNEDLLPYAARVQPPTLLMWGDQDQDTPLWQGELLEQTIPDAGLVVWQGAGHFSYLDRLPDTGRVIDHFFKQST